MPVVHRFSAVVLRRGSNYLVEVPAEISMSLDVQAHVPVVGTANGHSYRGTLVPAGGGRHHLLLNSAIRNTINVGEGDTVTVVVQRDTTSREPPMPDDFDAALDAVAGARHHWDKYPPSHRREMLTWINDAKKPETRARRIARAVAHVMDEAETR